MALEDAASLAEFVRVAADKGSEELPKLMALWSELRQERLANTRRMARGNADFYSLPDGPEQKNRDQVFAASTKAWKDELERLGEEGLKSKSKPKANPTGQAMSDPEARMYVYGYDTVAEARRVLEKLG